MDSDFIEKTLQYVANMVDGELSVCDDGYVICVSYPGIKGVDILYNEDGSYDKTIQHKEY